MIQKQRGVTLIELMVSMMLGLSLIAGMSQLFVQSQKSFTLQRNLSDMTDDGAFILESLAKGLLQAGYSDDGQTNAFIPDSSVLSSSINFAQNEFIHGTDSEFIYRYKLSSFTQTNPLNNFICTAPPALAYKSNDIITVRIYKANDTNGIPVLYCKVIQSSGTAKNADPLISNVAKLVIKYGVHDKTNNTFYYTDEAGVDAIDATTGLSNWTNVFSLKVFVVLRSTDDKLTRNNAKYDIDNMTYTATDNRLYKVFSKTIYLRAVEH